MLRRTCAFYGTTLGYLTHSNARGQRDFTQILVYFIHKQAAAEWLTWLLRHLHVPVYIGIWAAA